MQRILIAGLLLLTFSGCAPRAVDAPAPRTGPDRAQVAVDLGSFELVDLTVDDNTVSGWLDAPPEELWPFVPPVFGEIGFHLGDLTRYDPDSREVSVVNYRARRLADRRMSRMVRCGDSFGAPKADNGQVRVTVRTWLEPQDGGTRVHTRLEAWTRGVGTSTGRVDCSSKGVLEEEIITRLQLRYVKARQS